MKAKINVPTELNELTLGQYQHFQNVAKNFQEDEHNDFLKQKMLEVFCNIRLSHVMLIERKSLQDISGRINGLFTGKYDLQRTFKIKDIEFGFIPDLDAISQGEYVDLDTYITDWQKMHKAMAVLFRPINEKKEIQIRNELNGWSSDKTAETYNLRHIREEADRVMREDIVHWTNRAKKGK